MKALSDDSALLDDQGADHRVWTGCAPPLRRQATGQSHEMEIPSHRFLREAAFILAGVRGDFAADFFASASANAA